MLFIASHHSDFSSDENFMLNSFPVIRVSPTLTKTQQDITVDPESYVTLSCAATGKPQPVFSWFKNGRLQAGGTDGYFHIRYIRESANYTCQARNDAERTAESTSQVIVRRKWKFAIAPCICFFSES